MYEALLVLPAHLRARLASALDSGLLIPPYTAASIRSALGVVNQEDRVAEDMNELHKLGISGRSAAAWLSAYEQANARTLRPDLVWSGPEVPGLHARNTRRVFEELLGTAERSILASTYAFFDGPRAFEIIAHRLDTTPGLRVTLLLNIQRKRGDTAAADNLVRKFTDRFWTADWPGKSRPAVYYDPRSLDPDGPSGVLHAKALVADDESVFVTSANLTEAALDRNFELGILVRDKALAASVSSHFHILIERNLLKLLPES